MKQPETYIPLNKFKYDFDGLKFVLDHWEQIRDGAWPSNPQELPADGRAPYSSGHAYFEAATMIWSEVSARLDACGRDGRLVLDLHNLPLTPEEQAELEAAERNLNATDYLTAERILARRLLKDLNKYDTKPWSYSKFWRHVNSALIYCCGWSRKREGYQHWLERRGRDR